MLKKKNRKPLYYKKSKAAREADDDEYYESDDYQPSKQNKISPSRAKKSSKYDREYEYLLMDDGYGGQQYVYDYENRSINLGDDVSEFTGDESRRHRSRPGLPRGYSMPTLDYLEESDSDCQTCNSGRRQRSDYTSEYPSEYQNEEMSRSRYRNMSKQGLSKRKGVPSETEIDKSPYRRKFKRRSNKRRSHHQEYDEETQDQGFPYRIYFKTTDEGDTPYRQHHKEVYFDEESGSQSAYSHRQQPGLQDKTSESETEMDLEEERKVRKKGRGKVPRQRQNQSQFQIYAANTGESQGIFQKEQSQIPRERLVSVTNYDQSVPMVALKNRSGSNTQVESQAIVYLPVVVRDNAIDLPHSKVITAESLLRNLGDKAEKPEETNMRLPQTNMNVYLATENGQGNIFQQAKGSGTQDGVMPQNIQVYTASAHSIPVDKKPSVMFKVLSKNKNPSKSDYPVQKSYINVAPSRTKPVEGKSSKMSIKSGGSRASIHSSPVGTDKPRSPRRSSFVGSIHKKEIKDKKERKKKNKTQTEESDSALVSVTNPTDQRTSEYPKSKSLTRSASQTMTKIPTTDKANKPPTVLSRSPTFDRFAPLIKQQTQEKTEGKGSVTKSSMTRKSLEKQSSKDRDSNIITIKDIGSGKREESNNAFEQVDAGSTTSLTKTKSFTQSFTNKKDTNTKSNEPSHLGNKDSHSASVSSKKPKVKPSSSSKTLRSNRSVEFANKTQEFHLMKVLSFDSPALTYFYQVTQYFLGLTIHGTLMEIFRNTK